MIIPEFLFAWWLSVCAAHFKLDEGLVHRLMKVESGNKHHEIRFGRLGNTKYFGPGGLNINCQRFRVNPQDCTDPYRNMWTTCEVFSSLIRRKGSVTKALQTYNAEWTPAYDKEVRYGRK